MDFLVDLLTKTVLQVGHTFAANWPFLAVSVLIAAALKLSMDQARVAAFLRSKGKASVVIATGAAVSTPLCSCGTTAIILGMMAVSMPWAPIVAFMVSSPLTSPQELVFSAGLFGWHFAVAFFAASILLGLAGGMFAYLLEKRGWFANQARVAAGMVAPDAITVQPSVESTARVTWGAFVKETWRTGRQLSLFFFGFAFLGYLMNNLIPSHWISGLFGEGRLYGVALAAVLGIPFYFNTEASLPLARALMEAGMSQGAVLAFLITGSGTSIGANAGALAIARWRVVGLVTATLFLGAVLFGYGYNTLLALGVL